MATPTEQNFARVVEKSLERAWGAALDISTSDDFRHEDGSLDEDAYSQARAAWLESLWVDIDRAHSRSVQAAVRRERRAKGK